MEDMENTGYWKLKIVGSGQLPVGKLQRSEFCRNETADLKL
jgi:hypothetical protein